MTTESGQAFGGPAGTATVVDAGEGEGEGTAADEVADRLRDGDPGELGAGELGAGELGATRSPDACRTG